MTLGGIDITANLDKAKKSLAEEKNVSDSFKNIFEMMIIIVELLLKHFGMNSSNSSKPPSKDGFRKKLPTRKPSGKKCGGQVGHTGTTLEVSEEPDEIIQLSVNREQLPLGETYQSSEPEKRQEVHIIIKKHVIEYHAEVLIDSKGKRYTALFPNGVLNRVQYGSSIKTHAVYLSMYQLLPLERLENYFRDELEIPISSGTLFNFNLKAYDLLEVYDSMIKHLLLDSEVLNADETGIRINGKTNWLHTLCNEKYSYYYPHPKRGSEAIDEIGVLQNFTGILVHDCWKPYFKYTCQHALCNAHLLRELELCIEYDRHKWAESMKKLLNDSLDLVKAKDGTALTEVEINNIETQYTDIITEGRNEFPSVSSTTKKKAQSKAKNLIDRFESYQTEILRFAHDPKVPFTNNQGERDIRMTKVQQKISGCFRSMEGAKIFCRVRGFISTCAKNGVNASDALQDLFKGKLPDFLNKT